jgi:drug/metabolite transporter (DMT)-like permease
VLPATSLAYVLVALVGHFRLHEVILPARWLGIALITAGVGFVAAGPSVTPSHQHEKSPDAVSQEVRT